jgi:hypothetical protein
MNCKVKGQGRSALRLRDLAVRNRCGSYILGGLVGGAGRQQFHKGIYKIEFKLFLLTVQRTAECHEPSLKEKNRPPIVL